MRKNFKVVISDYDYRDLNIEKGEMEKHHIKMVAAQCKAGEQAIEDCSSWT